MTDKKYDEGKVDMELLFLQFPRALQAIPWAAMYGAVKYEDDGGQSYKEVSNGRRRYASAGHRHKLQRMAGEEFDQDSHVAHIVHEVWNRLAELEFALMQGQQALDPEWKDAYMDDWEKQAATLKGGEMKLPTEEMKLPTEEELEAILPRKKLRREGRI